MKSSANSHAPITGLSFRPRRPCSVIAWMAGAIATAVLAFASAPAAAESSLGTRSARASLDFQVIIPPVLRVRTLHQPATLRITERDIAAGYVDLSGGIAVEILSNLHSGHALQIGLIGAMVRSADISGLAAPLHVGSSAATVNFPRTSRGVTRTTLDLGVRLMLSRDAAPGEYAWPVVMTLVPA